ncbi:MAG TPA: hypothetical protein VF698_06605 [Thermoanaerobaculia bacterium]
MRIRFAALLVTLFSILTAAAQSVSVGSMTQFGGPGFIRDTATTIVDFTHPATESGTVRAAAVEWTGAPCAVGFKVKVLRRTAGTGSGFTVVGERGPFEATGGVIRVTLEPGINVAAGDLLAITQLTPGCGTVRIASGDYADSVYVINSDVTGNGTFSAGAHFPGTRLSAQATVDGTALAAIVPVVGAAPGAFGAQFRTILQLTNATTQTIQGDLVLHPIGQAASAGDRKIRYQLSAHKTDSLDLGALGVSGIFSMDVVTIYSAPPVIATRVFNDLGAGGTSGFSIDALRPQDALHASQNTLVALPPDPANFRMNVGVRALGRGATLTVSYAQPLGFEIAALTKNYAADTLTQVSLQDFVGGNAIVANGTLYIRVTEGDAIVYTSTTDNRTNDGVFQYAKRK